jgi:hypothetical protein
VGQVQIQAPSRERAGCRLHPFPATDDILGLMVLCSETRRHHSIYPTCSRSAYIIQYQNPVKACVFSFVFVQILSGEALGFHTLSTMVRKNARPLFVMTKSYQQ